MKPSEFLKQFGPRLCARIPVEGGHPVAKPEDRDLDEWASEPGFNYYLHVNPVRGFMNKASEKDVERVEYLHVDCDVAACPPHEKDPAAHLAREFQRIERALRDVTPKPTVLVFSGGGYQAYWKLREPVEPERFSQAKDANKDLARKLAGGDDCQSLDHLMRLPGTVNVPSEKKLAKNRARKPTPAEVVWFEPERVYSLDEFPRAAPEAARSEYRLNLPDELPALTDEQVAFANEVCARYDLAKYPSRSEWQWAVTCDLVRSKVEDADVMAALLDPRVAVSEAILFNGNRARRKGARAYAIKQVKDAHEKNAEPSKGDENRPAFILDKNERVINCPENIWLAVEAQGADLRLNEFTCKIEVTGRGTISDRIVDDLYVTTQTRFKFKPKVEDFRRALSVKASRAAYHPVRQYLEGLSWDGQPRLDFLLPRYAGAKDTPLTRAFGRLFLLAAVRRVTEPGIKFDEVLILEGKQGIGKSTFLRYLCPRDEWFHDQVPLGDPKEFMETASGHLILEIAELSTFKGATSEKVKAFFSRQADVARMAFGHISESRPRQCVFAGTTNDDRYFTDDTGNRRFWPVRCGELNLAELQTDRDQLWAEAYSRRSESIRLDRELWAQAAEEQAERAVEDDWVEILREYLDGHSRGRISTPNVYRLLGILPERQNPTHARKIGRSMRAIGWDQERVKRDGADRWCWVPRGKDRDPLLEATWIKEEYDEKGKVKEGTGVMKVQETVTAF